MTPRFRVGQWVICTHYKNKPKVQITDIYRDRNPVEIWVEEETKKSLWSWWGPVEWFKAIRPVRRPKGPRKPTRHSGFLCEDNVAGCTCNQSASVAQ